MEIKTIIEQNYFQVAEIYRQGIETGFAIFQDDVSDKIGQKNDIWKDNLILERRSKVVGL